jgi:6-phosphogluconolactonase (cycloisomerase 2 family)
VTGTGTDTERRGRELLITGCWTAEAGGRGRGLTVFRRDPADGSLERISELDLAAPSFLARHPRLPVLYAVNETEEGAVSALAVDEAEGTLRLLGSLPTGGASPCHLAVSADGRRLLAANYGAGSVAAFSLGPDGRPEARTDLVRHEGSGPDASRQEGPHAHMVVPGPDGGTADGGLWTAVDLGADRLLGYRLGADGRAARLSETALPPGFGPRHLVRAGDGLAYLVGELSSELAVLRESGDGGFTLLGTVPASRRADAPGNLPAHLSVSADGRLLFLSNRGADTVAVFRAGESPEPVGEFPCGGAWPRHLALDPDGRLLYVSNQESDSLDVLAVDTDGTPTHVHRYPTPSPTCALLW